MASHSTPRIFGFKAGADLSASQYCFVKFGSDDETVVLAGAGEAPIGILQNAPASGERAEVALPGGGAKLKAAGVVARGGFIKSDASGNGVAATLDKEQFGAKAMATSASGDVIAVEVVVGQLSI